MGGVIFDRTCPLLVSDLLSLKLHQNELAAKLHTISIDIYLDKDINARGIPTYFNKNCFHQ